MKASTKIFVIFLLLGNFALANENLSGSNSVVLLTLEDCISTALKKNLQLKIAEQKIQQSKFKTQEAYGRFLPSLNLSGTYTHISEIPTLTTPSPILKYYAPANGNVITGYQLNSTKFGNLDTFIAKLGIVQPIFTSGKLKENYRQTKLSYEYSQLDYDKIKIDIISEVKKSFYRTMLAKEFVKMFEQEVEVAEKHYQAALSLYKKGKASEFDASRVKVQLANSKTQLIESKNNLFLSKKDLRNLINLTDNKEFELAGDLEVTGLEMPEQGLSYYTDLAIQNRNELKQISIQEKISQSILKLAKRENRPNLNFMTNLYEQKPYYFMQDWTNLWDVSLSLTFPLFSGFSDAARARYTESGLNQIQTTREMLVNSIKLQIEKIYYDLLNAKERIEVQKENVETAQDNLKIAQEKYDYGLMSSIEVSDAELALRQSRMNYYKAIYDYRIAEIDLNQAIAKP